LKIEALAPALSLRGETYGTASECWRHGNVTQLILFVGIVWMSIMCSFAFVDKMHQFVLTATPFADQSFS